MFKERLSKAERLEAEKYGGTDDFNYIKDKQTPSYDKPDHYKRSCAFQPNHLKHQLDKKRYH